MNITDALLAATGNRIFDGKDTDYIAIRCADWPAGQHISLERMDLRMILHSRAKSNFNFSWSPTPNQLLADNWEIYGSP